MPIRFARKYFSQIPLAALLTLIVFYSVRAQEPTVPQRSSLDALATKLATAIQKKSKLPFNTSNVLVVDFVENQGPPTELGAGLAREFSDALNKHAQGFNVLDRAEYLKEFAADKLSADSYAKPETMKCYQADFGVMAVVIGTLDDLHDRVVLRVETKRVSDLEQIFDERISLPLTSEMRESISKPARPSAISPSSDKQASDSEVPAGGLRGYTMPSCVYCPAVGFSDAGSKAKVQGTILLNVQVGSSGSAENISVIHGLPCGMNQAAIDAVSRWRFKPANGPDGNHAAVTVPIEVEFHLY
jgi:TonB family protein